MDRHTLSVPYDLVMKASSIPVVAMAAVVTIAASAFAVSTALGRRFRKLSVTKTPTAGQSETKSKAKPKTKSKAKSKKRSVGSKANSEFRFRPEDSVAEGVQRMATTQIDAAIHVLQHTDELGVVGSVHDFRKRCKKLRGILRMVRPQIGPDYRRDNVLLRDASRSLSSTRDAQVMVETIDSLIAHTDSHSVEAAEQVRTHLEANSLRAGDELEAHPELVEPAIEALAVVRSNVEHWPLESGGFELLAGGIVKVYGRGAKMMAICQNAAIDANLHVWRKRTKYLWYHMQMLRPTEPAVLKPFAKRLKGLSDILGDDHDLAVLTEMISATPSLFGGNKAVALVVTAARVRRDELQAEVFPLGEDIYVEDPAVFVSRIGAYWDAWHSPSTPSGPAASGRDRIAIGSGETQRCAASMTSPG